MIDLSKPYKRVFTFGCSFTKYIYPTWADIISTELPNSEYYNFGKIGSGNLLISNRIAQANAKFKFCKTDLVLIMFSTTCREDRYLSGKWITPGNVYTQHSWYDKDFVKNYCDPEGFLIRDSGIIELVKGYMGALSCDTHYFSISSWLAGMSNTPEPTINRINQIYDECIPNTAPPVLDVVTPALKHWIRPDGTIQPDLHPDTSQYKEYLEAVGLKLTSLSRDYVDDAMDKIHTAKYKTDFKILFPKLIDHVEKYNLF
jgi:hypothetical protein